MGINRANSSVMNERAMSHALRVSATNFEILDFGGERLSKFVVDSGLDEESICADASLTGRAEFACNCASHRYIEVCVVEDDEWRVTSQLEREFLEGG